MTVYSGTIVVETKNNFIYYQGYTIDVEQIQPKDVIEILLVKVGLNNTKELVIDSLPKCFSKAEILLLLAVGIKHHYIFCNNENKRYDITFSYNFPLFLEKEMLGIYLENINEITESQLINLGEYGDFIRIDVKNKEKFEKFKQRVDYLVRKNDREFEISYSYTLESVLERWQEYCKRKFNNIYSQSTLNLYKEIYSQSGFSTITYLYKNDVVAQGVIFVSEYSKTIYYCIFAWDERFKSKSPGIYAYCKTIYRCFEEGYKFSFCYGTQKYKTDLLREFL